MIVSCPVAAPADVGLNRTDRLIVWPAFRVVGNPVLFTIVKPRPLIVAVFTVTGAVPVELSVSDCVVGAFSVTLPKLRLAALIVNCGLVAAVPVPCKFTVAVAFVEELLLIVSVPEAAPAVVGSNWTSIVKV